MNKIMFVDDEPIVRLAIKSLINWEEKGFLIGYEASNGKQALKHLEENPDIDIIITDISMPIMDGLDLIAAVAKLEIRPEIIVLSAYNDYDWVRKAFRFGVNDYILKTEMEPDGILSLVQGMADKIADKKKLSGGNEGSEGLIPRYIKEMKLNELLEVGDLQGLINKESTSFPRLNRKEVAICYLWVDDYNVVKDKYVNNSLKPFTQSVINSIEQILADTNSGEVVCRTPEEYIIIMSFNHFSQKETRNDINEIIGRIKYSLKTYVNISVSVGVSDVRSVTENINSWGEQAKQNVKLRFVLGKGRVILPETIRDIMSNEGKLGDNKTESILGKEQAFIKALGYADEAMVKVELDKLFAVIRRNSGSKIEKIYSCYMELLFVTISHLNKLGKEVEEVFGKEIDFYEKILRFETQGEIEIWITNMISWIIGYLKECKTTKQSRVIVSAIRFIEANYSNPEISLKMVSEYVELSESHFSTTFTKEIGETFTDYVTNIRIKKAKELITSTNMKLYEIAEMVGYTNAEHFSRVFKKTVGCSPKDFVSIKWNIKLSNNTSLIGHAEQSIM